MIELWNPWIKALHVLAIISWMAGQLYLPRLMVYHVAAERGSKQSETFKTMERRLLKAIMNPAVFIIFVMAGFAAVATTVVIVKPYVTARLQNLVWTRTGNASLRFVSDLRFKSLLWLLTH